MSSNIFLRIWERGRCKAQGEPMMEARGRTPAVQDVAPTGLTRVLMFTQRLRAGLNYAAAARLHVPCPAAAACVGAVVMRRPLCIVGCCPSSAAVARVGCCGLRRLLRLASAAAASSVAVACAGPVAWAIAEFAGCGCLAGLWHVRRIAGFGPGHLYSLFAFRPLIESGAAIFHAQAHFPTKPA